MFCKENNAEITDQETYFKLNPNFNTTKCSNTGQLFIKKHRANSDDVLLLVVRHKKVKLVQEFNKKLKFNVLCIRARKFSAKSLKSGDDAVEDDNKVGLGFTIFFIIIAALTAISCAFKPVKVSFSFCFEKYI